MIWRFTLHLKDVEEMTMELSDRLFESGCSDSSPSSSRGHSEVSFDREAPTLQDAIRSAVSDVRKAGVEVDRVEIESDELAETELAHWSGTNGE